MVIKFKFSIKTFNYMKSCLINSIHPTMFSTLMISLFFIQNENITCKHRKPILRKAKRTAINQQSSSNIINNLIQRNLANKQSKKEATYSVNVNLNITNFKGINNEPSLRNNEEFNLNINLSNLRNSEFSKKDFSDIIEISDEDVPNTPKIEYNKKKILLPKSFDKCNEETICKHSKIEKSNISCKPISSLLDKSSNVESRLEYSQSIASEIKTKNVLGASKSTTNILSCKNFSEATTKRNSINVLESTSKRDNNIIKKYTATSEQYLNLHLFDEPPQVTRVYAKVASHPDIIYTNTSQTHVGKDSANYAPLGSVPVSNHIVTKPFIVKKKPNPPFHKKSIISSSTQERDRLVEKVNINKNTENQKSKSNNKINDTNTVDEKSTLIPNLESIDTTKCELLEPYRISETTQKSENLDDKKNILEAFNSVCPETNLNKSNELDKRDIAFQNVQTHSCTNTTESLTTSKIINENKSNVETNKNNSTHLPEIRVKKKEQIFLETKKYEPNKSTSNVKEPGKHYLESNVIDNVLNEVLPHSLHPVTSNTKNCNKIKKSLDCPKIQISNSDRLKTTGNSFLKKVGTAVKKDQTTSLLKTSSNNNKLESKEEKKNTQLIPYAKDHYHKILKHCKIDVKSHQKISDHKKTEKKTSEQVKSELQEPCNIKQIKPIIKNYDQSPRQCIQRETTQEEFLLTVQLKPVFPRILQTNTENNLTKKFEASLIKKKSKFVFRNRNLKIKTSQENKKNVEKQKKTSPKITNIKNKIQLTSLHDVTIEPTKTEDRSEKSEYIVLNNKDNIISMDPMMGNIDVEHNINMLASVALTSVIKTEEEKKNTESLSNLMQIPLVRNSSNKYDIDDVNNVTATNVINGKRKSSVDFEVGNLNKKVKEDMEDKKSEEENKLKFDIDPILATKVTNNSNKSIDSVAMVLWEKKNIKSPEWVGSTICNLNSTSKQNISKPPIVEKPQENVLTIKKEIVSIDDKIKMKCSAIVEDRVSKNNIIQCKLDEKAYSEVLSVEKDNVLSKHFNFYGNISSFKESESVLNASIDKIRNKDAPKNIREEISMKISPKDNKKEINSELDNLDWYHFFPSPLLEDDKLDFDCDLNYLNNRQNDNILSSTKSFSSDSLISGYCNDYISSKQVGHANSCNPFGFLTQSDFLPMEFSQNNIPEQPSSESNNGDFFLNSETITNLELNPNEFLNMSTESVFRTLESSTTIENPDLDVISLEEMKKMSTENILNSNSIINENIDSEKKSLYKLYAKPSIEDLKKQISNNIENKKIIEKIETPSKLSRRMHKIPSGSNKKKIKLLTIVDEENVTAIKSSVDRNLSLVFYNNGSLPSLIDDDELHATDKPNLVRNLINSCDKSQFLNLEKISEKANIDYSDIFNKIKSEKQSISKKIEKRSSSKALPKVQLTKNSLNTLRNHDQSTSKCKKKYDSSYKMQNTFKLKSKSDANIFFENPQNFNLGSDNKIKVLPNTNLVEDSESKYNKQLNSHNRRKTDPNETNSNINLSDSKLHSQSSNSIYCRSQTLPNKKKGIVYAPIGPAFEKWRRSEQFN